MKVLVVMPTYGRIPYLNRAVASFLAQDYVDKHLLIINDDKFVTLKCDYKNVTCMNLNRRILLPQKRNIGTVFGYYDLIMQYDDDDIMLPHRISNHVKVHQQRPEISYYRNSACYAINQSNFSYGICSTNACSYKVSGWFGVNGYSNKTNVGDDIEFWMKLNHKHEVTERENVDYVYNWSGVNYHTTWEPPDLERVAFKQLVEMNLINKEYLIEPDFEQFSVYMELHNRLSLDNTPIRITHVRDGIIKIAE